MKYVFVALVSLSLLSCAKYENTSYSGTRFLTDNETIQEVNFNVAKSVGSPDLTTERNYNQMWGNYYGYNPIK